MLTKACARGGCTSEAEGKYCSHRCVAIARIGLGWRPQDALMRPEVRAKACGRGAAVVAAQRRRAWRRQVSVAIAPLMRRAAVRDLPPEQRNQIAELLGEAIGIGKAIGYQQGWKAKSQPKRTRKAEAA